MVAVGRIVTGWGLATWTRYRLDGDQGTDLSGAWPDFRDAATRGAALEVVRERWGAPYAQVTPWLRKQPVVTCSRWRVCINDAEDHEFEGESEAVALVAAMEAAP